MILIALVYLLMYLRIKQEANQRRFNSSHDSSAQMSQVSRTFTIVVVVYFVCYIPTSILVVIQDYSLFVTEVISVHSYNNALPFTNLLLFSNSCLNPLTYSKIHMKIYNVIKDRIARYNLKISIICDWCKQRDRPQSPRPEVNNYEMFVIPSLDPRNERNNFYLQPCNQTNDLKTLHKNPNTDQHLTDATFGRNDTLSTTCDSPSAIGR